MTAKILLTQDQAAHKKLGIDFAEPWIAVCVDDFDASLLDALPELIDQPGPLPPCLAEERLKLFVDRLQLPNELRILPHQHKIVVNHVGIAFSCQARVWPHAQSQCEAMLTMVNVG